MAKLVPLELVSRRQMVQSSTQWGTADEFYWTRGSQELMDKVEVIELILSTCGCDIGQSIRAVLATTICVAGIVSFHQPSFSADVSIVRFWETAVE